MLLVSAGLWGPVQGSLVSLGYHQCASVLLRLLGFLASFLVLVQGLPGADANVYATQMSPRVITTQYGQLRGVLVTLPSENLPLVEAYLGLQYASILGGELRFMPPTSPMETWDGIRVALKFRPVCPQKIPSVTEMENALPLGRVEHIKRIIPFLERQQEECLNLNVYVPVRAANDTDLLPVVIFIHGESYDFGTGNAYDGSVLASFGKMVVVTVNYRLGVLGFLSTGDSNAAGNYAILDQVAALHWIKENIQAFGGNPHEVTLMGQGYGAAMVNLLLISPVTKGRTLFKRAIIQSGSALSTWAICADPLRYTKELADHVNCSSYWGKSDQLLACFKKKPYEELIAPDIKAPKYFSAFAPVIDKRSVLPQDIHRLMKKSISVFGNTNVLMGVMKNEGFLYFNQDEIENGVPDWKRERMIRTYVRNVYQYHRQKIYEIIMHHYKDWERPKNPKVIRDNLMELLGDSQFIAPMIELTNYHSNYEAPTYMYSFSYPSRLDTYPRWAGGVHGDDMTYVFGAPLTDGIDPFPSTFTRSEKMLTEAVMRLWTNFVKSGNPNSPAVQEPEALHGGQTNRFENIEWRPYTADGQEYLHIGMRPGMRHHYRGTKMALWLDLIPKLHQSDNLEPKYHLLANFNNKSTFEEGTRELNMEKVFPPPPLPPTSPPTSLSRTYSTTTASTTTTPIPTTTSPSTATLPITEPWIPTRRPHKRTTVTPTNSSAAANLAAQTSKDGTLSLSVTIAVGCSLLFLNILIFAGVYYQKDRMRQEFKMRQRELEKEKAGGQGEGDIPKNSTGPDTDTNSSCMATPPVPPTIARHQVQPQMTSLPKQPIPVCPPQAPFSRHGSREMRDYDSPRHLSPRNTRSLDRDSVNKLRHSPSADSGTDLNSHPSNPVTMV